jgi:endonuclease/exonuclease/phosphatase (EEP) superfamily protein YafD
MGVRWLVVGVLVAALLVPAGLVTVARLTDPSVLWGVRLVAFTPYALLLYLSALLLLVVAAVRVRGPWRGVAVLLAALSLGAVVTHAYWARGPFLPREAPSTVSNLHVMTTNLRLGRADTTRVVRLAEGHDVDVLVLVEVTPRALDGLRAAGVDDVFAHVAGGPEPRSRGTMVFSRSPLGDKQRLDAGYGTYVVDVALPSGPVHLLAVHPQAPKGSVQDWLADQDVIRAAADRLSGPTMIVGDLNATMDHESLRGLVADGFRDAATQARSGWQPTWPSAGQVARFGVPAPPLVAIDHVLVRGGLRAVRTATYLVEGTDHRALVAALVQ